MTAKTKAKAPAGRPQRAKVRPKGRRRRLAFGDRLTRSQIGARHRIDRGTIHKYLSLAGAPDPDANGRFSAKEVLDWIEKNSARAGGNNVEIGRLREAKLRTEAEEAAFDYGVKRGHYVATKEIVPAIAAFNEGLTADLRAKFEFELPSKIKGRSLIEIQQMMAAAIDWVLRRLKSGQRAVTPEGAE